jgi:hypothetical protein
MYARRVGLPLPDAPGGGRAPLRSDGQVHLRWSVRRFNDPRDAIATAVEAQSGLQIPEPPSVSRSASAAVFMPTSWSGGRANSAAAPSVAPQGSLALHAAATC